MSSFPLITVRQSVLAAHHIILGLKCPINYRPLRRCLSNISKAEVKELGTTKIIPMLSRELPSALSLAKRQELATRMWNCWSKKEKKSIVLALESSPVDKTQAGTATVNADRPTLEEQRIDNPMPDLECWVDTSVVPHYATILIHKHFMVFRFTQTPNSKGSQGEWEETVALELAARAAIALGYSGSCIRVYSQSRAAIQLFKGVAGKVEAMNESVARLRYLLFKGDARYRLYKDAMQDSAASHFDAVNRCYCQSLSRPNRSLV